MSPMSDVDLFEPRRECLWTQRVTVPLGCRCSGSSSGLEYLWGYVR